MRAMIAGGGTGGHIYPGVTLARALQEKGAVVRFVGTRRGLEKEIIPREGFDIDFITADYFPRRLSWRLVRSVGAAFKGLYEARAAVRRFKPDICIGTGGYVAGPVVLAAASAGVPTMIQEQNAFPGLTNRWLVHATRAVALGYEEARPHFRRRDKLVVTGNPIRPDIVKMSRIQGAARLGVRDVGKFVLIFGASQGARSINNAVLDALDVLHSLDATFFVITGKGGYDAFVDRLTRDGREARPVESAAGSIQVGNNVRVVPYMYDMPAALAVADLVICRASAGSIAELTAKGIPSILIPYPHAADNHQEKNARVLVEAGASRLIRDEALTGDHLGESIRALLRDGAAMEQMGQAAQRFGRPDAVWDIVALIESIVARRMRH